MEKSIYTGVGDKGYTQTAKNVRISKADELICLIGTLDEYSATLGIAKAHCTDSGLKDDIEAVQKKLVSVMAELSGGNVSVGEECVSAVEKLCDKYLPDGFSGFTLPGENVVSAELDLARTVIRRAERSAAKVMQTGRIRPLTYVYLNRLSDMTYAMSQYAAREKKKE